MLWGIVVEQVHVHAALYGKPIEDHLAWSSKRELGPIALCELELGLQDEHIILGSAGLWSIVTADDAMLRSHFFVKVGISFTARTLCLKDRQFGGLAVANTTGCIRVRVWAF